MVRVVVLLLLVIMLLLSCELRCARLDHDPSLKTHQAERKDLQLSRRVSSKHKGSSPEALKFGLQWLQWQRTHNKTYFSSDQELEKYVVWRSNTAYIAYHNNYHKQFGYRLAMNKYGDMVRARE